MPGPIRDEDFSLAEFVVNQILSTSKAGARLTAEVRSELPEDLVLFDVQWSARQFTYDMDVLEELNSDAPVLEFAKEKVPLSLSYAVNADAIYRLRPTIDEDELDKGNSFLSSFLRSSSDSLKKRLGYLEPQWVARKEAQVIFRSRAIGFVAARISGLRRLAHNANEFLHLPQLLGAAPMLHTPGCNFTVTTDTPGLRVFWSGAHYISPSYFGHPTSPISRVLQSATYVFGVDGDRFGSNIQWDRNAVITLPGNQTSVHLNY